MCDEIMCAVAGNKLRRSSAMLKGYRRRAVRGEAYPAIFADPDGSVCGMLYLSVPASSWNKLDEYEGDMYSRERVHVVLEDGTTVPAETYVVSPVFLNHLAAADWDYERFIRHDKARYLKAIKLAYRNKEK